MKTVTEIVRSCPPMELAKAFCSIQPDFASTLPVNLKKGSQRVPTEPFFAGIGFHQFLLRMGDNGRLSRPERAYLPFLSAARQKLYHLGVSEMEIESELSDRNFNAHGVCDLVVRGGPQRVGLVEFKLVADPVTVPRPRDIGQLALYACLSRRWAKSSWAALMYIQPYGATPCVEVFGFNDTTCLSAAAATLIADDVAA